MLSVLGRYERLTWVALTGTAVNPEGTVGGTVSVSTKPLSVTIVSKAMS
jgi:hypothetical protein